MRSERLLALALASILLSACGSDSKPAPSAPAKAEAPAPRFPPPTDESARFPKAGLVDTKVVNQHLMEKSFMPGGTLAHYKRGKSQYEMFVARFADANAAAIALPDWRTALTDSKFIASFGGYFGSDTGKPVFVFAKANWIAGIAGLPEKEADTEARLLAARLN